MSGVSARLDRALGNLLHALPELEAAAVVTTDGLPMASALPAGMQEDRVAAMSAALLSLGERAAEGLGRGALRQVYVEGERGTVYLLAAGADAVLVGVASREAKAGLLLYELRHTAAQLAQELEQGDGHFVASPSGIPAAAAPARTVPAQQTFVQSRPTQAPPMPADPSLSAQRATIESARESAFERPLESAHEPAPDRPGAPLPWASFNSNQAWP